MHEAEFRKMIENENKPPDISAKKFLLRTLLFLPFTFLGWYLLANILSFPAILISDLMLPLILPSVIEGVEPLGYWADIVTSLEVTNATKQTGQFVFSLNALKYGYGLPLILAMILATPDSVYKKIDHMTYGFLVVVFAQTWGIIFETLSSLLLKTGPEITGQIIDTLNFTQSEIFLNLTALGYQLGFLILPAIAPIAFWVLTHQELLESIADKD